MSARQHNGQIVFVFVQIIMAINLLMMPNVCRSIRSIFCWFLKTMAFQIDAAVMPKLWTAMMTAHPAALTSAAMIQPGPLHKSDSVSPKQTQRVTVWLMTALARTAQLIHKRPKPASVVVAHITMTSLAMAPMICKKPLLEISQVEDSTRCMQLWHSMCIWLWHS